MSLLCPPVPTSRCLPLIQAEFLHHPNQQKLTNCFICLVFSNFSLFAHYHVLNLFKEYRFPIHFSRPVWIKIQKKGVFMLKVKYYNELFIA